MTPRLRQLSIFGGSTLLGILFLWLFLGNDLYHANLKYLKFGDLFPTQPAHTTEGSRWRDRYFQQVFEESAADLSSTELLTPNLAELCEATTWQPNLYLNCTDITAGLFNQVNEIKNCIRMAIDVGAHFVLPGSNERDSKKLGKFHQHDAAFRRTFRHNWDKDHITYHLGKACPQMKVLQSEKGIPDATFVKVDVHGAPYFREYLGYFDRTRTFREYAESIRYNQTGSTNPPDTPVVLQIPWTFLVMNPENDPSGLDWRAWSEISMLLRTVPSQRRLVQKLSDKLKRNTYIGVHLRVESDALGKWWDDPETQVSKNLRSIDVVASHYKEKHGEYPPIYIACGDKNGVELFRKHATPRGYTVLDKWGVMQDDPETLKTIDGLNFDAKGMLDYAVLLNSYFFLGTIGSSFSYTVANMRSDLGRYPGSSFIVGDTGNSYSHLFMPPSKRAHFSCCL